MTREQLHHATGTLLVGLWTYEIAALASRRFRPVSGFCREYWWAAAAFHGLMFVHTQSGGKSFRTLQAAEAAFETFMQPVEMDRNLSASDYAGDGS